MNEDFYKQYGLDDGKTGFGSIDYINVGGKKLWRSNGNFNIGSNDTYKFDPSKTVSDQVLSYDNGISVDSLLREKKISDNAIGSSVDDGTDDTLSAWNTGIKGVEAATGLGKLVLGFEQYNLAKDQYKFNKDMKEKEYAMAKDAYDRNKKRAKNISKQVSSYGSNAQA